MLDDRPGILAGGARAEFELSAGEVRQVTIDAREHGVCAVTLQLDLGGLPTTGVQVDLMRTGDVYERETLGKCDAEGRVSGFVRAWDQASVYVFLPGQRSMEHPDARLQLVPNEKRSARSPCPSSVERRTPRAGSPTPSLAGF